MAPTVRIDDEVYICLQEQARPFEDTPNSVLRRVLGLDSDAPPESVKPARRPSSVRSPKQMTGRQLNKEWKVGAKHPLFHRDGCWYNNLVRFPGALFDYDGYILFETEQEYKSCPYLDIKQQTNVNVTPGISAIPGYVRKRRSST